MSLSLTQVTVGSSDTLLYTVGAVLPEQVTVRAMQARYGFFVLYRGGAPTGGIQEVNSIGDKANFGGLQTGDTIHGIAPENLTVDVQVTL